MVQGGSPLVRRMSETPTTTTSQKSIAIRPQFVLQYAPNLYCIAFGATEFPGKGNSSVLPPFVLQYASHLYRSTSPICIAIRLPFVSQYFWENLGGCGHRDVLHLGVLALFLFSLFFLQNINQPSRPDKLHS